MCIKETCIPIAQDKPAEDRTQISEPAQPHDCQLHKHKHCV